VYQFPALVVVSDDDKPIGVLSEGDVCRAVNSGGGLVGLAPQPAYAFATKSPTCMDADTEVSEALHKMLTSGLTLLPVTDEERFIGVVLRVDLMQAMLLDIEQPA
jgi:CBS domain-containing protein